ncbi:MAG: LON peptidase substrate-binding domain-containing protein, partial [Verrucomicrobiales bacterium]|nr:LON peptidase substrate-binding domain-containing protein [Verrucomicrobiales bacterium]
MPSGIPIPNTLPVIILSECQVFPGSVLPLFIFEPRYRIMLADVLASNRMFCIGSRIPGASDDSISPSDIASVSTAALVRASVENKDGTSNLILQGLSRVRFTGWFEPAPYPTASVVALETTNSDKEKSKNLADSLVSLLMARCESPGQAALQSAITPETHPGQVADIVAQHFISDFSVKQQ